MIFDAGVNILSGQLESGRSPMSTKEGTNPDVAGPSREKDADEILEEVDDDVAVVADVDTLEEYEQKVDTFEMNLVSTGAHSHSITEP